MFFLYIDPGTGSMLFSLFIGIAAGAQSKNKANMTEKIRCF